MKGSKLPEFVSYLGHGEVDFAAPLLATDDLLYGFLLESKRENVQALVDSTLAAPAKGEVEYRVLGNHVILVFQYCGRFTSPIDIGWADDHETALMIPLIEKRPGLLHPAKLVLWMPYLMIDVGLGMITGRDVWGYNKSLGTTVMPTAPTDPPVFNCKTLIFEKFAADTQARVDTLIEVARKDGSQLGALEPKFHDGASLIRELEKALGPFGVKWLEDAEIAVDLASLLLKGDVPVINLKQMRDTEHTKHAVVQELVAAMLKVTKLHSAGLLEGDFTVKILQCDSHQIGKDFGFPTGGAKLGEMFSLESKFAFWAKLDFNAAPGTVVWKAK